MATDTELVVEMVQRIDHLLAVLEPAKRVDDKIVHLNSVFGIRFRNYMDSMMSVHFIFSEINKSVELSKKKYAQHKSFDLSPKHYIEAIDHLKKAKVLLAEILDVVKLIYASESHAYSVEIILNKQLVEIKNNVDDWGNTTHPIMSELENIDKDIVGCRREINSISVEIRQVYGYIKVMYDILMKEQELMNEFYSKALERLEHFKRYYDHMPTAAFNNFGLHERETSWKMFAELDKDSKRRFNELDRVKHEELVLINKIKNTASHSFHAHKDIRNRLDRIRVFLRNHSVSKQLVF